MSNNNWRAAAALRRQAAHIAGPVAGTIGQVAVSDLNTLDRAARVRLMVALTSLQGAARALLYAADLIDPPGGDG